MIDNFNPIVLVLTLAWYNKEVMGFIVTPLPGVLIYEPQVFSDARGFFMETFQKKRFAEAGIALDFVQDNHSRSQQGILRGLHYQIKQPQGKLVRVVVGEVFDVAVDIRRSSAYFGQWFGCILSAENKRQLWVPPGFAHGYYTISDVAEFLYKATDFYAPAHERTILWNDPDIGINWPIESRAKLVLSEKDARGLSFLTAEVYE